MARLIPVVSVILVNAEGRVLLQLRDDRPDLLYPGCWTLPGGYVEQNETPAQAVARELLEEMELTIPLNFWGVRTLPRADYEVEQHYFTGRVDTPAEEIPLHEGQMLRFVGAGEIDHLAMAFGHENALREYFAGQTKPQTQLEQNMIDLIKKLVETYGPSGHEEQIREAILLEIGGLADEITVDAMGSVIAWKRSGKKDAPVVMISAHMDEIGVMVSHITEEGFLRFTNIGGLFMNSLHGNRVLFADGTIGAIGVDSEVSPGSAPTLEQLFIDVGDGSGKKKGGSHSIKVGDAAGLYREMVVNGDRLIAKSMDDRIGCALAIEVMRAVKGESLPNDVAFVFSVQEEVGVRGAQTSAYAVDPDIGIAIDVTRTGDTPKGVKMDVALGAGPAIKVKDSGMLAAPEVIDLMEAAAKKAGIPHQFEILERGSTDARAMQLVRAGVRAGCLSVPCRYVHTTSEIVDLNDVQNGVTLLVTLLRERVAV